MGWIAGSCIGKQIRILRKDKDKRTPRPSVTMDNDLKDHVIIYDAANILFASAVSKENAEELWLNGHGAVTNCEAYHRTLPPPLRLATTTTVSPLPLHPACVLAFLSFPLLSY